MVGFGIGSGSFLWVQKIQVNGLFTLKCYRRCSRSSERGNTTPLFHLIARMCNRRYESRAIITRIRKDTWLFPIGLTWKSVLPHPRIKSASPVNAIACSSQTYVTQPAQISDEIFTLSCFTSLPPSGKYPPIRFSDQIYIYLFAAIRFVIGPAR